MITILAAAIVSVMAVLAIFAGLYITVAHPDDLADRLEAYAAIDREKNQTQRGRGRGLKRLLAHTEHLLSGQTFAQKLALYLAQANMHLTAPEFVIIMLSMGIAGSAMGYLIGGQAISAIAAGLLGLILPLAIVMRQRQKRLKAFSDQLADVLALVVGSLRGGHALMTALDLVSKELGPPASEEFARVLREIGLGLSQSEALGNLVKRMESDDLQLVVTAVNISHEVGGNLSVVLEKIGDTIRERVRLHGEIRVLTTQQRLTTYLLAALPFALALALSIMNPSYIMRLFAPGFVRLVPLIALVFEAIGFFLAQKLTRIEV